MAGIPKTLTREDVPDVSPPLDPEQAELLSQARTSWQEFELAQSYLRKHPGDKQAMDNAWNALQHVALAAGDLGVYYYSGF